jgi:hypothetical protein
MTANSKQTGVEWVGGLASMPAYVTGEGEPYRPEALFWMGAEGAVLGHTLGKPGELLAVAADSLRATIERPIFGKPHAPARVRVASPELAEALRAGHPGLDIVCAPTPEIDVVLAGIREKMGEEAGSGQSYLGSGIGPDAIGALFRAAAGLFRAKPWEIVPSDESLLSVTIEKFGVRDAALSVIGQLGESLGLILFSGLEDFEVFLDGAIAVERGEEPTMPSHFALSFERGADLDAALRKEITQHRWEVAGADAYPWLVVVDEDIVARPPTAEEVAIAEAIALALTRLFAEEEEALLAAWNGGEAVERTLAVATHAGSVDVSFRVPYLRRSTQTMPAIDVLAGLLALAQDGEELDEDARGELEDELVYHFLDSAEGKSLAGVGACHLIMNFAADYFGATIATLQAPELREIVFEIIPRKVSVEAAAARGIIDECRAFYTFLARECGLRQADACLRVLGGDAVRRLEAALSDSGNFGMAKSLLMGGHEAGFDMSSREGIEAWMREMQSRPLPEAMEPPFFGAPSRPVSRAGARAKKKNQRKAARKARKKNR